MPDQRSLIDALKLVRRRVAFNRLAGELVLLVAALLSGLVLAGLLSPGLYPAIVAAVLLLALGAVACLAQSYRRRLSLTDSASALDRAAGLKDRLGTAFSFLHIEQPEGLVRMQRDDAFRHLAGVSPHSLFPVRWPRHAAAVLVLAVIVGALFAYRLSNGPPGLRVLRAVAETRLVQAIVSPIAYAMEPEPPETARSATPSASQQNREQSSRDASPNEGAQAGQKADERGGEGQGRGKSAEEQAREREDQQEQGEGEGDSEQQAGNGQGQEGQQGQQQGDKGQQGAGQRREQSAGNSQQSGEQQSQGSQGAANRGQSLASSIMQALKNLFTQPQTTAGQAQSQQAPSAPQGGQDSPQNASNSNGQQQSQPSDAGRQPSPGSSQNAEAQSQQPGQKAGNGVGDQAGSEQSKAADPLAARTKPEEVPLESQQFTGEAQVRARTGEGKAQTPTRRVSAPTTAAANGAEQESIPLRYRLYVQRYFDQSAKGRK